MQFGVRSTAVATGAVVLAVAIAVVAGTLVDTAGGQRGNGVAKPASLKMKDARLRFEINATDGDGGVHALIDADAWKRMSVFDPEGRRVFTATAEGRIATQGGTELFLESAEPPFAELPLERLLDRFPAGIYRFRGISLAGKEYVGSTRLSHDLPAGPVLVSPIDGAGPQDPDRTVVRWKPVPPPNGSPIIGYQVLIVQPDTGIVAMPKITLDVTMPPTATSLAVPPGFLQPGTEYEWEVLAIEQSGNQTLSSSLLKTVG